MKLLKFISLFILINSCQTNDNNKITKEIKNGTQDLLFLPTTKINEAYQKVLIGDIGGRAAVMTLRKFGYYAPYTAYYYFLDEQKPRLMTGNLFCFFNGDSTILNSPSTGNFIHIQGIDTEKNAIKQGAIYEVLHLESDYTNDLFTGVFVNDSLYQGFYITGQERKMPFKFSANKSLDDFVVKNLRKDYSLIDSTKFKEVKNDNSEAYIDIDYLLPSNTIDNNYKFFIEHEIYKLLSPSSNVDKFTVDDIDLNIRSYFNFDLVKDYKNPDYKWGRLKNFSIPYFYKNLLGIAVYDCLTISLEKGDKHQLLLYSYDLDKKKRITYNDIFIDDKKQKFQKYLDEVCRQQNINNTINLDNFILTMTGVYFVCTTTTEWRSNVDTPFELFLSFDSIKEFLNPNFKF